MWAIAAWTAGVATLLVSIWLTIRYPLRVYLEAADLARAQATFRMQREALEIRFVLALGKSNPAEAARWDDADWHNEVTWGRDRRTRALLALVGVDFPTDLLADPVNLSLMTRHATALFEYRRGRWHAEGRRLDEVRPDEAFQRGGRFEPVVFHQRRA